MSSKTEEETKKPTYGFVVASHLNPINWGHLCILNDTFQHLYRLQRGFNNIYLLLQREQPLYL